MTAVEDVSSSSQDIVFQDTLVVEVGISYPVFQLEPEDQKTSDVTVSGNYGDVITSGSHGNDITSGNHGDVTQNDDVIAGESFLKPVPSVVISEQSFGSVGGCSTQNVPLEACQRDWIISTVTGDMEAIARLLLQDKSLPYIGPMLHRFTPSFPCCIGLHWACKHGRTDIAHVLLQVEGCDVNCRASNGMTALHIAAQAGHEQLVEFLVDKVWYLGDIDTWCDPHRCLCRQLVPLQPMFAPIC
eukprot:sb/3468986/